MAHGKAVEAGLVCPSGQTATTDFVPGSTKNDIVEFTLHKTFTCNDGTGSWTAFLDVRLNNKTARTTASWVVIAGSDDYVNLTGAGRLRGDPIVPEWRGVLAAAEYLGRRSSPDEDVIRETEQRVRRVVLMARADGLEASGRSADADALARRVVIAGRGPE